MKEESPIADDEGKLIVEYENPDAEIYPDDDLPEEEDNEEENLMHFELDPLKVLDEVQNQFTKELTICLQAVQIKELLAKNNESEDE